MLCSCSCSWNISKFQFMLCFESCVGAVTPVLPACELLRLVLLVVNAFCQIFALCGFLCFLPKF